MRLVRALNNGRQADSDPGKWPPGPSNTDEECPMRYKLVLKVFAESEATQESVELNPGGIVWQNDIIPELCHNLHVLTEQGWGEMSEEEIFDFRRGIRHEAEAVARLLEQREQAVASEPATKRKKSKRKSDPQGTTEAA